MKKTKFNLRSSNNNWSPDNPYNGDDDEEGGDFWESFMEGFNRLLSK